VDREAISDRYPAVPRRLDELGIPVALVHDLVLRQALYDGRTSTVRLAEKLRLSPMLLTGIVEELRELRLIEIQGLDGRDYRLALTEAGRSQANDRMQLCRYAGAAPVSLEAYAAMIDRQHANPVIDFEALQRAFADLVISDDLLWELGPAAIAGGAMFLYGPPGTGKSSIAERLLRIYEDNVLVPYAVEVDGQIINVFDPVVHRPCEDQPAEVDPRWVLCHRPSIIVGGELVGSMLDLQYQAGSGIYLAPLQMQANNGILVIDDFGRQTLTPEQLLNRWIVPLDRQVDYLSLDYGMKFEIPFDAKIVFSTNLAPETLGDEAFFRRIQSKILIPTITDDQFDEVLRRVAVATGVEVVAGAAAHLRSVSRQRGDGDLRPYLPGAVCRILRSICTFAKLPARLDPDMVDRIAAVYFTHAAAVAGGDARPPSLGSLRDLAVDEPQPPMAAAVTDPLAALMADRRAAFAPAAMDRPAPPEDRVDEVDDVPAGTAPPPGQSGPIPGASPGEPAGPSWAIATSASHDGDRRPASPLASSDDSLPTRAGEARAPLR
jgi:DNA-binding Lrp family transcriptional regulator